MTDREIELAMDKLIGRVWDEGRCRVCGWPLGELTHGDCIQGSCALRPHPKEGSPCADDPLPHTTSWEQIAKDREMLPVALRQKFIHELYNVLGECGGGTGGGNWDFLNFTPRQQSIAWLRAHGVEVEG